MKPCTPIRVESGASEEKKFQKKFSAHSIRKMVRSPSRDKAKKIHIQFTKKTGWLLSDLQTDKMMIVGYNNIENSLLKTLHIVLENEDI